MIASDFIATYARPWLSESRVRLLRVLIPATVLGFMWWMVRSEAGAAAWVVAVVYALSQLGLILAAPQLRGTRTSWLRRLAIGLDGLLALLIASGLLGFGGVVYPLAALIALRTFASWKYFSLLTVTPLVLVLGYLIAAELVARIPSAGALSAVTHWWLLVAGIGLCVLAVLTNRSQQREINDLRQMLRNERQVRDARVNEMERTANELRARMREQHALEEGLRVITSSLSLDEVLNQIVDSTIFTLGRQRVSGMALSLMMDETLTHHAYTRDGSDAQLWADPLARRTMQQGIPLIVSDAIHNEDFASLGHRLRSVISVPLFVGEGPARGSLTVISSSPAAFSSSDTRHLAAFAAQAGIAIANAEMHSRIHEQQQLMEAVIRDISDGLVVVDEHGQIVLTNPTGQQVLEAQMEHGSARERLLELAANAAHEDQALLVAELKLHSVNEDEIEEAPERERVFQALASHIRQDGDAKLVAIALHDITHYRAEEKARTDFISMVSHELRNPLHSLNGFLKVVTQGRAGDLSPLQQDFLQMADQQVELLKGRITELLEYNRIKAGRLTLKPKVNDLNLLVDGTVNRLQLQAEQNGLELHNDVRIDLPECNFDSERIGQVLTNLIENAIKATQAGGRIYVGAHLREGEVWISVRDTGIGIAQSDLGKIFKRFYRANTGKSVYGSHLGLGLTICQQIVEGHGGRIWVESEIGVGSTFTFALPLASQNIMVE
ncbi:MAG: ATP-binding protein [Roseiflexaceae bacterium]